MQELSCWGAKHCCLAHHNKPEKQDSPQQPPLLNPPALLQNQANNSFHPKHSKSPSEKPKKKKKRVGRYNWGLKACGKERRRLEGGGLECGLGLTSRDLVDLKALQKIYGSVFGRRPLRTAWQAEWQYSGTPNKPCAIFHPIFYQ